MAEIYQKGGTASGTDVSQTIDFSDNTRKEVKALLIENNGPGTVYIKLNTALITTIVGLHPLKRRKWKIYDSQDIQRFSYICEAGQTASFDYEGVDERKLAHY